MDMNANDNSSSKNGLPYIFSRGSDPRAATCRGKLQSRRCKLNQEINKELRLRAGAENLFKATTNRKLRDTISVELSFVNSNLQLLKEQLAELNSSVEVYQNDGTKNVMPMIPLGLKETKEINFMEPFSDFILEHYSEDSTKYTDAIADITDTRQAARTPARDHQGVSLLFRYYNLLYYVERRFFPPDRNIGVYFEWYDSLTGVPSCQRTIAFEKACILFNLGSIFTQIGARQERTSEHGLDLAVDNFLRAAGIFRHIYDTFTNAPSMDLKPQVLEVFVCLMLAQARECLYEKLVLQAKTMSINNQQKDLAGEAAQLSNEYKEIHKGVQCSETQNYLPECWAGLIPLKSEYYKALAHYHTAKSIKENSSNTAEVTKHRKSSFIETLQDDYDSPSMLRAHVSEAISSYEEAQRLQRMCRFLKNKTHLTQYLSEGLKIVNEEFSEIIKQKQNKEIQDQFDLDGVNVQANTKFKLSLTGPDFSLYKVSDPFRGLGPIAIFSARRHWTAPRFVRLKKCPNVNIIIGKDKKCNCSRNSSSRSLSTYRSSIDLNQLCPECGRHQNFNDVDSVEKSSQSFGFHVKGDAPVTVSHVEQGSLADLGGIKEGDFIVEVSKVDVKWFSHQQVVGLIQESGLELEMKVVTDVDRSYLKKASLSTLSIASSSGISSDSSVATTTHKAFKPRNSNKCTKERTGTLSSGWNLFRRTNSLGKIFS